METLSNPASLGWFSAADRSDSLEGVRVVFRNETQLYEMSTESHLRDGVELYMDRSALQE